MAAALEGHQRVLQRALCVGILPREAFLDQAPDGLLQQLDLARLQAELPSSSSCWQSFVTAEVVDVLAAAKKQVCNR